MFIKDTYSNQTKDEMHTAYGTQFIYSFMNFTVINKTVAELFRRSAKYRRILESPGHRAIFIICGFFSWSKFVRTPVGVCI